MVARTDNVTDPAIRDALLLARRGQARWARALGDLRDDELDKPSLLPGWSLRHVIAHVGFNARAIARLVEWARTGEENPMYASPEQRGEEIDFGATLPADALRNLCAHASIHLNVEWRDLPDRDWSNIVRTAQGRLVPVSETVWMRTREVWIHAIDLNTGIGTEDFPDHLVDLLLDDLLAVWRRKRSDSDRNVVLHPTDREQSYSVLEIQGPDDLVVHGTAADIVGWGIGRTRRGVTTPDGSAAEAAPGWL